MLHSAAGPTPMPTRTPPQLQHSLCVWRAPWRYGVVRDDWRSKASWRCQSKEENPIQKLEENHSSLDGMFIEKFGKVGESSYEQQTSKKKVESQKSSIRVSLKECVNMCKQ